MHEMTTLRVGPAEADGWTGWRARQPIMSVASRRSSRKASDGELALPLIGLLHVLRATY